MDPNTRAFAVILGEDADPELVRNTIRMIPGVDTVSAQTDDVVPKLRDALAWYADPAVWDDGVDHDDPEDYGEFQHTPDAYEDAGERARAALGARPEEE